MPRALWWSYGVGRFLMSRIPLYPAAVVASLGSTAVGTKPTCLYTGTTPEREFFIGNLQVQIHFIIEMIWWTGLAPWELEFPFPGSLTSTFLDCADRRCHHLRTPKLYTRQLQSFTLDNALHLPSYQVQLNFRGGCLRAPPRRRLGYRGTSPIRKRPPHDPL